MKWDAAADAKLMATIVQEYDVKLSGEKMEKIAKVMGCTPKAITHRMAKMRQTAKAGYQDEGSSTPQPKPRVTTKSNGKKKKVRTPSPAADAEDDKEGAGPTPPPSRPRRAGPKRDYAQLAGENSDDEDDGLDKKVKIEVGEDIGEGLRPVNDFEDENSDSAGFFS